MAATYKNGARELEHSTVVKYGYDRKGRQRLHCNNCNRTFISTEPVENKCGDKGREQAQTSTLWLAFALS